MPILTVLMLIAVAKRTVRNDHLIDPARKLKNDGKDKKETSSDSWMSVLLRMIPVTMLNTMNTY